MTPRDKGRQPSRGRGITAEGRMALPEASFLGRRRRSGGLSQQWSAIQTLPFCGKFPVLPWALYANHGFFPRKMGLCVSPKSK